MPLLTDALQAFNRRERHILVGWVLDRLAFPLGQEFRDALSRVLRPVQVPADAYVAMDYNLNWLCAALMWADGKADEDVPRSFADSKGIDLADNSDTDLLVAFARGARTHVVLLEAKGYTRWDTAQLRRKTKRLNEIFDDGNRFRHVVPHWIFVSPTPPPEIEEAATWMVDPADSRPRHLPLPQPATHRYAIGNCDSDGVRKMGDFWKIRRDPWPGPEDK